MPNLEIRDSFFTRLKLAVEESKLIHQKKVCPFLADCAADGDG